MNSKCWRSPAKTPSSAAIAATTPPTSKRPKSKRAGRPGAIIAEETPKLEKVSTPGKKTVAEVAEFLKLPCEQVHQDAGLSDR